LHHKYIHLSGSNLTLPIQFIVEWAKLDANIFEFVIHAVHVALWTAAMKLF